MFRLMLDQSARAKMVTEDSVDAQRKLHLKQLLAGDYHRKVEELRRGRKLCEHAEASLRAALDLDARVSRKHDGTFVTFPGPGAVLVTMLDTMERERLASAAARTRLDHDPGSVANDASANGCSAENVGTHTLMSKDATSKEPLRPEAVALAKHASAGVALRFLQRVTNPGPVAQQLASGVNWDAELQYYVRGVVPGGWESELLSAMKLTRSFTQPDVASLRDQPHVPLLGPASEPEKLVALRAGGAADNMERYYRNLES